MTRFILFLTFITVINMHAISQHACKTFTKDGYEWQVCYYKTGQKSTEISYALSDTRWKSLKVYDRTGKVIYEESYGPKHGSSGVELKYYPDGGVSSAHYTMQPDGGIQYTDITTYFKPDGTVDHVEDYSRGNDGEFHVPPVHLPAPSPTVPRRENKPVECTPVPPLTQVFLINYTSEPLHIRSQFMDITGGPVYCDVDPSDTVRIGAYNATPEMNPLDHFKVKVETRARYSYEYRVSHIPGGNSGRHYIMVTCRKLARQSRL